jgi:hypothetical protein
MSRLYLLIQKTDPETRGTPDFINFVNAYQTYLECRQRYIYLDDWKRPEQNDIEAYLSRNPSEMDKYMGRIEQIIQERGNLKVKFKGVLDQAIENVIESDYLKTKYQFEKEMIETFKLGPDYVPTRNTRYLNKKQLKYELKL